MKWRNGEQPLSEYYSKAGCSNEDDKINNYPDWCFEQERSVKFNLYGTINPQKLEYSGVRYPNGNDLYFNIDCFDRYNESQYRSEYSFRINIKNSLAFQPLSLQHVLKGININGNFSRCLFRASLTWGYEDGLATILLSTTPFYYPENEAIPQISICADIK
jgi:hypothetical protein